MLISGLKSESSPVRVLEELKHRPNNDDSQHKNLKHNITFLVSSTAKSENIYLRDRIIPSARTWMRSILHNVYVVVEG